MAKSVVDVARSFVEEINGHDANGHPGLRFTPTTYRAKPASLVAVRGVHLAPHDAAAALIVIENHGKLPKGSEYRFQVQQVIGKQVVGGRPYVIRIAGHRDREQLPAFIERY